MGVEGLGNLRRARRAIATGGDLLLRFKVQRIAQVCRRQDVCAKVDGSPLGKHASQHGCIGGLWRKCRCCEGEPE
jgi:hypothetical protein